MEKRSKIVETSGDDAVRVDEHRTWDMGLSILVGNHCGLPHDGGNVYFRAWDKIQDVVEIAIEDRNAE
jgi:hypothetical protein